jgi:hypothetical protein
MTLKQIYSVPHKDHSSVILGTLESTRKKRDLQPLFSDRRAFSTVDR